MQDRYDRSEHLYFLPIGGTAMAPLAGLLHELGHHVEGVDSRLYPPMSTLLEELEIPVRIGFDPRRIPDKVDRVIIGNAVPRHNPEVEAVLDRGISHLSQAEAVAHYVLARGQHSLVVAGTHGKTTSSSMLAWILEHTGLDPSFLVGGMPRWSGRPYRRGSGRHLVIEGDEYNTAFFDRGPKFLHYRPQLFLLGPVEFDHADIYRDLEAVMTSFRAGAAQVPTSGAVVVNAWSENAVAATRDAAARVLAVGPTTDCALHVAELRGDTSGSEAVVHWDGARQHLKVPMAGDHNLHNAAMAVAAALTVGLTLQEAVAAVAEFPGIARRQEVVGEVAGVVVVDDFAHHPTALVATISAARQLWPDRRLVVAFEPRSLTAARRSFQDSYLSALKSADLVLVAPVFHRDRLEAGEAIDREQLALDLEHHDVPSVMPADGDDPAERLVPVLAQGDVVIGCSSGSFDGFHGRLLELLAARTHTPG